MPPLAPFPLRSLPQGRHQWGEAGAAVSGSPLCFCSLTPKQESWPLAAASQGGAGQEGKPLVPLSLHRGVSPQAGYPVGHCVGAAVAHRSGTTGWGAGCRGIAEGLSPRSPGQGCSQGCSPGQGRIRIRPRPGGGRSQQRARCSLRSARSILGCSSQLPAQPSRLSPLFFPPFSFFLPFYCLDHLWTLVSL